MSQPQELFDEPGTALATVPQTGPITPLGLIQSALSKNVAPEVLKELVALQQSMIRFDWEAQERQARIDFDTALNECQQQIERVVPNQDRENGITWADYAQIDRAVRPIYIKAGFSVGFSEMQGGDQARLRMCATLSRGGISREYFSEISRNPANSKMNQLDADASAASRVKRYLMLSIFNISVGIDKDEKAGIAGKDVLSEQEYAPLMEAIEGAETALKVTGAYIRALKAAKNEVEKAAFEKAANKRKAELQCV
jgi:hypothetical protein